jgi:hypothetical protein
VCVRGMVTEGYRATGLLPETCFPEDNELAMPTPRCLALLYNRARLFSLRL